MKTIELTETALKYILGLLNDEGSTLSEVITEYITEQTKEK